MKHAIVLVHSYPTNSILLKGCIEFLSKYFTIYPIDLPGFHPNKKPKRRISIEGFARHVSSAIKKAGIRKYWICGISFGFLVANRAAASKACIGILAIEPYINSNLFGYTVLKKSIYKVSYSAVCKFGIYELAYKSRFFYMMMRLEGLTPLQIQQTRRTIDPYTFFETGRIVMYNKDSPELHNKPYIVLINEKDATIRYEETIGFFSNCSELLIINTSIPHYPKDLTRKYFEQHMPGEDIAKVIRFMDHKGSYKGSR